MLVFEQESSLTATGNGSRLAQPFGHCFALRFRIIKAPEVEDANPVDVEHPGKRQRAFQQLALLFVRKAGAELIALWAELRFGSFGPIDLEDRGADGRNAEPVLLEE